MKRVYLITHCEAFHTVQGRVGGWYDSELTESGRKQAIQLSKRVAKHGFDFKDATVYTSDLKRALQTAEILIQQSTATLQLDSRLREMSFGSHGGMVQAKHNRIMIPVPPDDNRIDHRICDGAESRKEVATRMTSFVDALMQEHGDAVVVTHGFAATFFIAAFQKISIGEMGYLNYRLKPGSITILEEDDLFGNRSIVLLNE